MTPRLRQQPRRNPNSISRVCRRSNSITAVTDIRAFLAPGVPTELARAALRRAWSADPAIRDFVGLAENAWDFTDPTAMPGFGALPPGTTSRSWWRRFSATVKSRPIPTPPQNKPADPQATHIAEEIAPPEPPAEVASATGDRRRPASPEIPAGEQQVAQSDFVQRDNNIASHNSSSDDEPEERKNRRQHGGALPQ